MDGLFNLAGRVRSAHLSANARLAFGYHGKGEADDIDAQFKEPLCQALSDRRIKEHHRNDRVFTRHQREACSAYAGTKLLGVGSKPVTQRMAAANEFQYAQADGRDERRQCIGKEVWARALSQPADRRLPAGHKPAGGPTERLAEGAGEQIHPSQDS